MTSNKKLKASDEEKLLKLFHKLDVNNDGKLCFEDVVVALKARKAKSEKKNIDKFAEDFFNRIGLDKDDHIDFNKFVSYILEHDKKLLIAFKRVDTNSDGMIDAREIQLSFKRLGVDINMAEATQLLKKVDTEGNLLIDYNEWREFLLFHPTGELTDIVAYWRHNVFIDVGEESAIPEDFSSEERQSGKYMWTLLAGGLSGAISRTCTAPLDRVKVMMMVYGYKHKGDILSRFRYMISEGGYRSMWRGNFINVIKIAPETAIKYSSYESFKIWINKWKTPGGLLDTSPLFSKFIAGSLAGSTAQTIIYPLEVMKTRMCLRKTGQFTSMSNCATTIFREGGIRAFYRGYLPNLCGIFPYAGIEMALYETCKRLYMENFEPHEPSDGHPPPYLIPFMATSSSMCGIMVTYPLAVVRTKLQSKSHFKQSAHNSVLGLCRTIVQVEGLPGFYRGLFPNLIKVVPAVSISYACFEILNERLGLQSFGSK